MTQWTLAQTVAPAEEPISLAEAKRYGWVDSSFDDVLISDLAKSVRSEFERLTGLQLVTATWKMYLDNWPCSCGVLVPKSPLLTVSSITYVDTAGATQTLASSVYQVDAVSQPGRITTAYGQSWPSIRSATYNAVTITFTAGYGTAASVPFDIKQILWQATLYRFEHRIEETDELWLNQFLARRWPGWIF